MEPPPRPKLFDFHGVSMTKCFTDNWDNVQNVKARPDDILIATYPKAGKFQVLALGWQDYIVLGIIHTLLYLWICCWMYLVGMFTMWRPLSMRSYVSPSGTTWVSQILDLLYFGQTSPERQSSIPIHIRVPFLDLCRPSQPTGWAMTSDPFTPHSMKQIHHIILYLLYSMQINRSVY